MPFLDKFDVILLDQGKTFLFENDRFGPGEDYHATYCRLGGRRFGPGDVREMVERVMDHMFAIYRAEHRLEDFPTVHRTIEELTLDHLDTAERDLLEGVVAEHEAGVISELHAGAIRSLARSHRLGIVSNIFARRHRFLRGFEEAGIADCFEHHFWSSDHGWIKPSRRIFPHVLERFRIDPARVLMVGDNLQRDIAPAAGAGCATAWITNGRPLPRDFSPQPDVVIDHLADLHHL